jgi:hypothetical protein
MVFFYTEIQQYIISLVEIFHIMRQQGFNTGDSYYGDNLPPGSGTQWDGKIHCTGKEESLDLCPHEGWVVGNSRFCLGHKDDAAVMIEPLLSAEHISIVLVPVVITYGSPFSVDRHFYSSRSFITSS